MLEGLRALEPVELYKYCFSEPVPETPGGQQSVENSTQHRFRSGKLIVRANFKIKYWKSLSK